MADVIPRRSVRIVSDGTNGQTKIYLREKDGQMVEVPLVKAVTWSASIDSPHATACIWLNHVEVDVIGEKYNHEHD